MTVQLTDTNFEEEIKEGLVFVDFWAEWCGPCRMVGPVVDELSKDYEGKAVIGKVNVDNNPDTAGEYGIRNIPTILFFKNGEVVDKVVGVVPKEQLAKKLESLI